MLWSIDNTRYNVVKIGLSQGLEDSKMQWWDFLKRTYTNRVGLQHVLEELD